MKWHCGLLDKRPEQSRTLEYIKRGFWELNMPEDVERELRIWMSMPGFSQSFHMHTLGVGCLLLRRWMMRDYDQFKAEVAENWLSVTRDDAVRLSQMRPGKVGGDVPLICKLQMMTDLKAGARNADIEKEYRVSGGITSELVRGIVKSRAPLPSGFELLVT